MPVATDPWLLTDVLRAEWGLEGTVVSDYWSIAFVAKMHRTPEQSVAGAAVRDLDSAQNRAPAREVAERSVILLNPGTVLPLLGGVAAHGGRIRAGAASG